MISEVSNYYPYETNNDTAFTLSTANQTIAIGVPNYGETELAKINQQWRVMFYSDVNRGSGQNESHTNYHNASLCSEVYADEIEKEAN